MGITLPAGALRRKGTGPDLSLEDRPGASGLRASPQQVGQVHVAGLRPAGALTDVAGQAAGFQMRLPFREFVDRRGQRVRVVQVPDVERQIRGICQPAGRRDERRVQPLLQLVGALRPFPIAGRFLAQLLDVLARNVSD